MTLTEQIITIAACSIGTMLTRFLPFLVFSSKKPTPDYIQYLGRALPCAIFAMLVVYCLKDVSLTTGSHGLPEASPLPSRSACINSAARCCSQSPAARSATCCWSSTYWLNKKACR